ncbi:MAG: type VI secretion system-associated FHA domain protein TagH [Paracoccaceae bacterium]
MPLVLRIDNVDTLPDGGPVFVEIDRRGIDIGRDTYLDWTLPDPERFISGKHCEIHFRDGAYWLHDVSTNGTSVNGNPGRLTEPHRLAHGDRIHVGPYIVNVELSGVEAGPGGPGPVPEKGGTSVSNDPWGGVDDVAESIDRRDFTARSQASSGNGQVARGGGDLSEENISWGFGNVKQDAAPAADVADWGMSAPAPSESSGGDKADPPGIDWGAPPTSEAAGASPWDVPAPSSPKPPTDAAPPANPNPEPAPRADPAPAPSPTPVLDSEAHDPFMLGDPEPQDPAPADVAVDDVPDAAEAQSSVAVSEPDSALQPEPPLEPAPQPAAPPETPPQTATPMEPAPTPVSHGESGAPPQASPSPAPVSQVAEAAPGLAGQWSEGAQAPGAEVPPAQSPAPAVMPAASGAFVAAFERGAGLPAGAIAGRSDEQLGEELGELLRTVSQSLQAMLLARAETKSAMRSSERTMIGALENNPLKFSPTPEDAMRIMFGQKTKSYLDAKQTFEQSFGDLQSHQMQTFGAMQSALQVLIEDLDPENIAGATAKDGGLAGLVSSRRAKFWDTYVERFKAKSGHHDRGMIDAIMILFAEMYDRQG